MIEHYVDAPSAFTMAAFALFAFDAPMDIVLSVTCNAFGFQRFVFGIALVTVFAGYVGVFSEQLVVRVPIVIEIRFFPFPFRVTAFTFFAVASPMDIVTAVATDTGRG